MSEFVNQLHYGDNLERLRNNIPDEVADLIYLDPPFNSARNYNLLFKQHKGQDSPAQIMAFEDTWSWSNLEYERFKQEERNQPLWKLVGSLYDILGPSEMMAYVVMMTPRLLELHRKLKPTGSLYLHCDSSASHYLKLILDSVFGPEQFGNEVIWQRQNAKGLASTRFARNHDVILRYTKTQKWKWNSIYTEHDPKYLEQFYKYYDEENGRRYSLADLTNPNKDRPNLTYEFLGITRVWRWTRERMLRAFDEGLIFQASPSSVPRLKRFLDEQEGNPVGDIWSDIPPIQGSSKERRGYPTQKPLALLERIIAASSNEGDVVLDPFAGCGTAIVAAERMNRKWIGIDVTYLAINEIVDRLQTEKAEGRELKYNLVGTPKDESSAVALFENTKAQNHKSFEQWAVTLVRGKYNDKKGADRGIDGRIPLWDLKGSYREGVIQVKGGQGMTLSQVRDFGRVIERENAVFGILICQKKPTKEMLMEAESMGFAEWPGLREIPRFQIYTTEQLLEGNAKPIVPENYRIGAQQGVGKSVDAGQDGLFE
jgi:site-specific DNA-methyltransferase (adenine-specific)